MFKSFYYSSLKLTELHKTKMKLSLLGFALLLVCTFVFVQGQVPFFGRCPDRAVVQNFEAEKYLGRWYEIEKYFAIFEAGGMCVQAYYSAKDNGTIGVMNSQIQEKTGRMRAIQGVARPLDTDGSAKFGVTFDSIPFMGEAPYFVLDTDYKNYSIVWSCSGYALLNFQILWFLARESNPSVDVINKVHEKMDEMAVRRDLLMPTNHTNCAS